MMKNTLSFANQSLPNPRFSAPKGKQKKLAPTTAQNTPPFNNHKQRVTTPSRHPLICKIKNHSNSATNTSPIKDNSPHGMSIFSIPTRAKKGRLLKCRKTALPSKRGKHQKYNKTPPATTKYRSAWKPYKY